MSSREKDARTEEVRHALRYAGVPGTRAAVYLLDGAFHVCTSGTPMQAHLDGNGALLVAWVTWDGSHAERPAPRGASVRAAAPEELVAAGWAVAAS